MKPKTKVTTPTFRMEDGKRDLELREWQAEHIRRGRESSDAGPTYSTEEVRAMMAEYYNRRKAGN